MASSLPRGQDTVVAGSWYTLLLPSWVSSSPVVSRNRRPSSHNAAAAAAVVAGVVAQRRAPLFHVDVMDAIAQNAPLSTVLRICQTNRQTARLCQSQGFWARMLARDFPVLDTSLVENFQLTYRSEFLARQDLQRMTLAVWQFGQLSLTFAAHNVSVNANATVHIRGAPELSAIQVEFLSPEPTLRFAKTDYPELIRLLPADWFVDHGNMVSAGASSLRVEAILNILQRYAHDPGYPRAMLSYHWSMSRVYENFHTLVNDVLSIADFFITTQIDLMKPSLALGARVMQQRLHIQHVRGWAGPRAAHAAAAASPMWDPEFSITIDVRAPAESKHEEANEPIQIALYSRDSGGTGSVRTSNRSSTGHEEEEKMVGSSAGRVCSLLERLSHHYGSGVAVNRLPLTALDHIYAPEMIDSRSSAGCAFLVDVSHAANATTKNIYRQQIMVPFLTSHMSALTPNWPTISFRALSSYVVDMDVTRYPVPLTSLLD